MKYWAKLLIDNRRIREITYDADMPVRAADSGDSIRNAMVGVCKELDIERPVITNKHINDIKNFRHCTFLPQDFMDSVDFDKLTIEIFFTEEEARLETY